MHWVETHDRVWTRAQAQMLMTAVTALNVLHIHLLSMRLNARLIEFISIQTLLGPSASGDTVTTVFMDSPALQFVLNYLCSALQQRGGRLQTVPGICLVFSVEEVIAGWSQDGDAVFPGMFRGLSLARSLSRLIDSIVVIFIFFRSLPEKDNQQE